MMVDCTFSWDLIIAMLHEVLMVFTSKISWSSLSDFPWFVHNPISKWVIILSLEEVWIQAGTHLTQSGLQTPSTPLGLLAWRDQASE